MDLKGELAQGWNDMDAIPYHLTALAKTLRGGGGGAGCRTHKLQVREETNERGGG